MNPRFGFAALFVVGLVAFGPAARADDAEHGTCTLTRSSQPNKAQLELRSDYAEHSSVSSFDVDLSQVGVNSVDLDSDGKSVHIVVTRDAGTFDCDARAQGGRASGTFTFKPSAAFAEGMRRRGYADMTARRQFAAAALDITIGYVDALAGAGFSHLSFDNLIAFRALNITAAYASDLRSAGVRDLTANGAIQLKALGVDKRYLDGLARAGYPNLNAQDLVQMKALGIDERYIDRLAQHGFRGLTVSQLVQMKAVGI